MYSIATGNRAPSTALAAGRDTLASGVIEALGRIHRGEARVLLVHADERPPEFYRRWVDPGPLVFALGLVLAAPRPGNAWRLERADRDAGPADGADEMAVVRMLAGGDRRVVTAGERERWLWERD